MTHEEREQLVDHALRRGADVPLPEALEAEGEALREVADWLDLADVAELSHREPPAGLLDRIHASTGPAPSHTERRLAPSWLGRWTPAVAAALLAVVIGVAALWPHSGVDFVEFELASQNGIAVSADFKVATDGDTTTFDVRANGLEDLEYDVWVRTSTDGERHWIGRFEGNIQGGDVFVAHFAVSDIERLWVTDPAAQLILGHDLD